MKFKPHNALVLPALALTGLLLPAAASANHCGMKKAGAGYPAGSAYRAPMSKMAPMRGAGYGYRPQGPRYGAPAGRYSMQPPAYGARSYGYPTPGYGAAPTAAAAPATQQVASAATQTEPAKAASADAKVQISQMRFNPPNLTIKAGDTVTWTQADGMPHTVTSRDGDLASPTLYQNSQFSFTFDEPGTYDYICSLHPNMTGRITVE
jgi:amicyanin